MLSALQQSAIQSQILTDEDRRKWMQSTTHKETKHFLEKMKYSNSTGLMYERVINDFENLSRPHEDMGDKVWRYIDLNETNDVDETHKKLLQKQKEEMKSNYVQQSRFEVSWEKDGIQIETHSDYLKVFGDQVKKDLLSDIQKAVDSQEKIDEYVSDIAQHVTLCHKRAEGFKGRKDLFQTGTQYFDKNPNGAKQMLIIYAVSGAGKTSFIAALAMKAKQTMQANGKHPVLITRFCGTSPFSSNACDLLNGINYQIMLTTDAMDKYHETKKSPENFKAAVTMFHECLLRATESSPILVFIDSLDQLSDQDQARANMAWLPNKLPEHVYLVVSTLPDIGGCFYSLKTKSIPDSNFIEIGQLAITDVESILNTWLESVGRRLQPEQFAQLLKLATQKVQGEQPTVLRLKLLFDLAKKWASYDPLPDLVPSVRKLLEDFFEQLERIHGKAFVERVFGLLSASRRGLSEDELLDIVSTDDGVLDTVLQFHQPPIRRIPQVVFARLRNAIGEYMVEKGANNKSDLAWYHRQFQEACQRRYGRNHRPEPTVTITGNSDAVYQYPKIYECPTWSYKGISDPLLIAKYFSEEAHQTFPDRGLTAQPIHWLTGHVDSSYKFNRAKVSELPHAFILLEKYEWDYSDMAEKYLCNLT